MKIIKIFYIQDNYYCRYNMLFCWIKQSKINDCIEKDDKKQSFDYKNSIELTTDNWKDYFEYRIEDKMILEKYHLLLFGL